MRSSLRKAAVVVLALCVLQLECAWGDAPPGPMPRDVLKGIEAMQRLPADGFHLVQSQGRLLVVSTNGHFAISGGRILDLWNNVEIRSVSDVEKSTRLPLARLGIEAQALGGTSWGRAEAGHPLTVFLDPGSSESRRLLPALRAAATSHRVDVVFVPAQPARAGISRALICDHTAALAFLERDVVPRALSDQDKCGIKELERARVTVELLGIATLPFSVAPNGATASGVPSEYAQWIAANGEGS
jgi:thiol:disulfide interchange protein DsbC